MTFPRKMAPTKEQKLMARNAVRDYHRDLTRRARRNPKKDADARRDRQVKIVPFPDGKHRMVRVTESGRRLKQQILPDHNSRLTGKAAKLGRSINPKH